MNSQKSTSQLWSAVTAIFNNPDVLNLTSTEKLVYIFIAYRQGKNSCIYHKEEDIARQCGVKIRQLRNILNTLIDLKLINKSVKRHGGLSWQYVYSMCSISDHDQQSIADYQQEVIGTPLPNGDRPIGNELPIRRDDTLYIKNKNKKIKIKEATVDKNRPPDFIPSDSWKNYLDYRKAKDKKMLSLQAQKIAITRLTKFHDDGYDVAEILEESILRNWSGLFPVKKYQSPLPGETKTKLNPRAQQLRDYLDSLKVDLGVTGGESLNFFPN